MAFPGHIGNAMPPSEDTQVRRITDLERAVRELAPSVARSLTTTVATLRDLVAQVTATLADINATVAASIAENSMTTAAIQDLVATPGNITPGNVNASGDVTVAGALRAPQVPVTILTSAYFATYATTVDGKLGHVPSSAQFKQDIRPTKFAPLAILDGEIVDFRYKAEVALHGDAAPYVMGGIAEQFHAAGLGAFVNYDDDGNPFGIAYERLAVGIIPLLQQLNTRVANLEAGPIA